MLTMTNVSQKTISMMKYWVSMFHAQSLKNAPNLTVVKNQHNLDSLATDQMVAKPFVSQVVQKKNSIILRTPFLPYHKSTKQVLLS